VLHPIADHLSSWLSGIPVIGAVFAGPFFGPSYFAAGIVLAIMVLPIVTAICREVFAVAPVAEKEAALALGATRWEMLRMAVLPYSRAGISGARAEPREADRHAAANGIGQARGSGDQLLPVARQRPRRYRLRGRSP